MSDEKKTAIEEGLFEKKIFPSSMKDFEDKHGKIKPTEEDLLKELLHFFNLHKRVRKWKSVLSKKEKEDGERDFIKRIITVKDISQSKAETYYNEVFKAHEVGYKKIVGNVSVLNIFFPLVIVLLLLLIIFL